MTALVVSVTVRLVMMSMFMMSAVVVLQLVLFTLLSVLLTTTTTPSGLLLLVTRFIVSAPSTRVIVLGWGLLQVYTTQFEQTIDAPMFFKSGFRFVQSTSTLTHFALQFGQ